MALWDSTGQEDYERLRQLTYLGTDVILLCLTSNKPTASAMPSLKNKWIHEINQYCPGVPVVLTAIHDEEHEDGINDCANCAPDKVKEDNLRRELAHRIGAVKYQSCDLATCEGIDDVFEAVRIFLYTFCFFFCTRGEFYEYL
jgi:GTPase SAR1 family protein